MKMRERAGSSVEGAIERVLDAGYLKKWMLLGLVIGVVAGLGAVTFTLAIRMCSWLLLDVVGGYVPPAAVGEGNPFVSDFARPWAVRSSWASEG